MQREVVVQTWSNGNAEKGGLLTIRVVMMTMMTDVMMILVVAKRNIEKDPTMLVVMNLLIEGERNTVAKRPKRRNTDATATRGRNRRESAVIDRPPEKVMAVDNDITSSLDPVE